MCRDDKKPFIEKGRIAPPIDLQKLHRFYNIKVFEMFSIIKMVKLLEVNWQSNMYVLIVIDSPCDNNFIVILDNLFTFRSTSIIRNVVSV